MGIRFTFGTSFVRLEVLIERHLSIFIAGIFRIYGLLSDIQHSMVYDYPKSLILVAEGLCAGTNDHGVIYFNHSTSFWPSPGQ
jgi:hypothetical protein